jgi:putative transposase
VDQRIAPSVQIEAAIEAVLTGGLADPDALSTLGRLGAQLVLQRAVEDEVAAFLRRARYERTLDAAGSRNGSRPRRVQTAEGEITINMPQVRDTLTRFVSSVIPDTRSIIRTRPLEALVIGAYVRGLSDRDIESLAREAGLGSIPSRTAVSTVCRELRDRYRAFRARSLGEVRLLAMFLDAIYLPVRPDGPKEGVLVAWGFTTDGERILLDVCLGARERTEDWLDLGQGLIARGLRSPLLVVSDGAPGLIRAITELWPDADRGRCAVHRLRNILAKLPKRPGLHARVRAAYWAALDGATSPAEAENGLRVVVAELSSVVYGGVDAGGFGGEEVRVLSGLFGKKPARPEPIKNDHDESGGAPSASANTRLDQADTDRIQGLIELLQNGNETEREKSIVGLWNSKDSRAVPPILIALGDSSWAVRHKAIQAFRYLPDDRAILPLIQVLKTEGARESRSQDLTLIAEAARVLARLGAVEAIDAISERLSDLGHRDDLTMFGDRCHTVLEDALQSLSGLPKAQHPSDLRGLPKVTALAVKAWYRDRAISWWRSDDGRKTAVCDDGGDQLQQGEGFLRPGGYLCCETHTDSLLCNADWKQAIENLQGYFGPGLPDDVTSLVRGSVGEKGDTA